MRRMHLAQVGIELNVGKLQDNLYTSQLNSNIPIAKCSTRLHA